MTDWLTTLGAGDWVEPVIYGIGTIIVVGGWIANSLKQANQQRMIAQRRREQGQEGVEVAVEQRSEALPSYDEIARRRREQLAALRRGRTAQPAQGREAPAEVGPSQLSVVQAAERQLAKAAYEQRAEQLRQQDEAQRLRRERESVEPRQQQQRESELALQRAEQARQVKQQQRTAARRSSPRPLAQPSAPRRPVATPARTTLRSTLAERTVGIKGSSRTIGTLAVQSEQPDKSQGQAGPVVLGAAALTRQSLRRAVILKEILSPPIGLRDPIQ